MSRKVKREIIKLLEKTLGKKLHDTRMGNFLHQKHRKQKQKQTNETTSNLKNFCAKDTINRVKKHALEKLITKEINEQLVTPGILTIIQQMGAS